MIFVVIIYIPTYDKTVNREFILLWKSVFYRSKSLKDDHINSNCLYIPKCQMSRAENETDMQMDLKRSAWPEIKLVQRLKLNLEKIRNKTATPILPFLVQVDLY